MCTCVALSWTQIVSFALVIYFIIFDCLFLKFILIIIK